MCQFRRGVSQGGAQAQSEREKIPYLFREWIRHQSLRKLGQDWYHQCIFLDPKKKINSQSKKKDPKKLRSLQILALIPR